GHAVKGYWHITALGIVVIQLYLEFKVMWFIGIFLCWLMILFSLKRMPFKPFIITLYCMGAMYLFHIDKIAVSEVEVTEKQTTIEGRIKSAIEKNEKKLSFILELTNSKRQVSVVYFPTLEIPLESKTLKHGATCKITGKWE